MAPKSPRRKGALQQAKEYLRINPSATNAQVVEALNVSIGTVSAARSFLVQTGVIQRSFYDRSSPMIEGELPEDTAPGPILATSGVAELEKEIAARQKVADTVVNGSGVPLTAEEQRQRLSTVARNAAITGNFQLEIAAIQALARLDAQIGARDRLGPGPPLTDDDKIHRLSLLLEAVGKRIARKAWERVWNEQSAQDQTQNSDEHRGSSESAEEKALIAPENATSPPLAGSGAGEGGENSDPAVSSS